MVEDRLCDQSVCVQGKMGTVGFDASHRQERHTAWLLQEQRLDVCVGEASEIVRREMRLLEHCAEALIFDRGRLHSHPVQVQYPTLKFDLQRDCFVVWLRWVEIDPPTGSVPAPAHRGIRVELMLNRNSVLGPVIVRREELDRPVYLQANRDRTCQILADGVRRGAGFLDLQLVIHGSVANAPFAAVYHVQDYSGAALDRESIAATPLLQLQPSIPGDRWQVSAQSNLRVRLEIQGTSSLRVLR